MLGGASVLYKLLEKLENKEIEMYGYIYCADINYCIIKLH